MSREEFILTIPVQVRVTVDSGREAKEDTVSAIKDIIGGGSYSLTSTAEIIPVTKKATREAWRNK